MSELTAATFSYDQLDPETRIVVQQRTSEIATLMKRTADSVIEIGEKLIDVKNRLDRGQFGEWLRAEFSWSERTAQNFMNVAQEFGGRSEKFSLFAPSALYALSAPSTPEKARQEALKRAESGEKITHKAAKEIVAKHKPEPEKLERLVNNHLSIWCRGPEEKLARLEAISSGNADAWNQLSNYVRNSMPVSSERLLEAIHAVKEQWQAQVEPPVAASEPAREPTPETAPMPSERSAPAEPTSMPARFGPKKPVPALAPQPPRPPVAPRAKDTTQEVRELLQAIYDLGVDELSEALASKSNKDGNLSKLYDTVASMLRRARGRVDRGIGIRSN